MPLKLIVDNRYVQIKGASRDVIRKLESATSYLVAGFMFSPAFRARKWDGREHLLKFSTKRGYRAPVGLLGDICAALAAESIRYDIDFGPRVRLSNTISFRWNTSIVLRPYQNDAVSAVCNEGSWDYGSGLLKMPIRSGKALLDSEPVLTTKGWKQIGTLSTDDCAIGSDGKPTQITGIFPQGMKDVYKVEFDDGTHSICSKDHLWTFGKPGQIKTVSGYTKVTRKQTKSLGEWMETSWIKNPKQNGYLRLDLAKAVAAPDANLGIDPYTLGVMLGDGTFNGTPGVTIADIDSDIIGRLIPVQGTSLRMGSHKRANCKWYSFSKPGNSANPMANELRKISLWGLKSRQKFIPSAYMKGSIQQRLSLLQGILDTDGSPSRKGATLSTFSKKLAEDVLDLSRSLGAWASIRPANGDGEITVYIRLPNDMQPFMCKRKKALLLGYKTTKKELPYKRVISITPFGKGNATCISIKASDGLFVTRGYTLTHNTKTAAAIIHRLKARTLFIVPSQMLLHQTADSLEESLVGAHITKIGDGQWDTDGDIVVATVQSLTKRAGGTFKNPETGKKFKKKPTPEFKELCNSFDLVIFDESHHLRGDSWHGVVMEIKARYRIGLSATIYLDHDREVERGAIWLKACCGDVCFEVDTSDLIKQGYLMRQNVELVPIRRPSDLHQRRWSKRLQDDAIYLNSYRNAVCALKAREKVKDGMKVLVISRRHAQVDQLCRMLDDLGVTVEPVTGKEPMHRREELVDGFVSGYTQVLVGTVFGEGIDIPAVEAVINAEGGRDIKATVQRQRNMTKAEGKSNCVFVDMVDLTNEYFATHSAERVASYRSEPEYEVSVTGLSKELDVEARSMADEFDE